MPIQLLSPGVITPLTQNVIFALPAAKVTLYTDTVTPTLTQSSTSAFTLNTAVTMTAGQATVAGGFIRTSVANVTVLLKRD